MSPTLRTPWLTSRPHPFARAAAAILMGALACVSCGRNEAPQLWQAVEVPTDATFDGAWFTDTLNGWLSGGGWDVAGGIIGRTRDGGRSWSFQSGIVSSRRGFGLGAIDFRDTLRGCVVGGFGNIWLSDDGGRLWRRARNAVFPSGDALLGLQFLDARQGWAHGNATLAHTEDGGETWHRVRTDPEDRYLSMSGIHYLDDSSGWLLSHTEGLMRTYDGGRTWTRVPLPTRPGERPTLRDLTFLDTTRGWVVGEIGSIFHTADGGETWMLQENGVPVNRAPPKGERPQRDVVPELEAPPDRLALMAVRFADAMRGWAVGYYSDVAESVVLGTRDGGMNWTVEHVQRGELLRALCVLDSTHAWAAGDRARTSPQVVLRYVPNGR